MILSGASDHWVSMHVPGTPRLYLKPVIKRLQCGVGTSDHLVAIFVPGTSDH